MFYMDEEIIDANKIVCMFSYSTLYRHEVTCAADLEATLWSWQDVKIQLLTKHY